MNKTQKKTAPATRESLESMLGNKLGMQFNALHGPNPQAKTRYLVDIDAWMSLEKDGGSDNSQDTITHSLILTLAEGTVEAQQKKPPQAVSELIASNILDACPQINAIRVKLSETKDALTKRTIQYFGVEIIRQRNTSSRN